MIEYHFDRAFKKSGKSLRQLGELTGVGFVTLHKLSKAGGVKDCDVCLSTVEKICKALEVELGSVLKWK